MQEHAGKDDGVAPKVQRDGVDLIVRFLAPSKVLGLCTKSLSINIPTIRVFLDKISAK